MTELAGAAGAKIHTARSRNDQVATDLRLWCKRELIAVARRVDPEVDGDQPSVLLAIELGADLEPAGQHQRSELVEEHPAVAATDAAVIEHMVVGRIPEATWHYRHDIQACAALVEKGTHTAALLCSPVSVATTRAAAIDRVRMPQKTTLFSPKPRTGMVFRPLD